MADGEQKNPSLAQWSSTSIDVQGRLLLLLDAATAAPDRVKLQRHALLNARLKALFLSLSHPLGRLYCFDSPLLLGRSTWNATPFYRYIPFQMPPSL